MIRQHTDKWYKMKAACFGATDVASLLGHGYECPDQIIQNKIHYVDSRTRPMDPTFKYLADRGTRYEPVVRDLFASRHKVLVRETGLRKLPGFPWQTASPDGMCIINGNKQVLLEFKVKRSLSEAVPYKHWIQMQAQMAVWGVDACIYCQNVIQEFASYEDYALAIAQYPGIANGILDWQETRFFWRLNEFQEITVEFDPDFWDTTLNTILIPAWKAVEHGREKLAPAETRKRKREDKADQSSKKKRKTGSSKGEQSSEESSVLIEPHMINNWFRKDPLLDWLNLYGDHSKKSLDANPYVDMIRIKNNEFASIAKSYIEQKYSNRPGFIVNIDKMRPEQFIVRSDINIEADKIKVSKESIRLTAEAIANRVPIIMNACLSSQFEGCTLQGVADMLVLNGYIDQIFGGEYSQGREDMYSVVKFKFSTIDLRADGTYLLNNDKQKVYKGQLWILNHALEGQQGYLSPNAYVVGRKYQYTKCRTKHCITSAFGKLGVIDFSDIDAEYNTLTREAIEWHKRLADQTSELQNVDLMNPNHGISELLPNMKNHSDYPWSDYKMQIAEQINDITLMYKCGKRVRDYALEQGLGEWVGLDEDSIVFNGHKVVSQILEFVNVNKEGRPSDTANSGCFSKTDLPPLEFYIDFESVGNMYDDFSKFPQAGDFSQIFLIGAVVVNNVTEEVTSFHYLTESLDKKKEYEMVLKMFSDFQRMSAPYGQNYLPLIFWGNAEKYMLERVLGHDGLRAFNPILVDMCKIFRECKIIYPGQFGYGLKQVAKVMYDAGHIQTIWRKGDGVADGISAMSEGLRHLRHGNTEISKKFFRDVIEYNYVDCKVMQEMMAYFRR
jgi:hypothetical protein